MFGSGPIPDHLETGEFVLKPLTLRHAELDYAALMDSTETLRAWSGTSWPADDFTLEQNREDLERHDREHREGTAYTFTVLNSGETECLGCVYITPLLWLQEANPALEELPSDSAVVGFWVRASRLSDELDRRLIEALVGWFRHDWVFPNVCFSARTEDERQLWLLGAAGLEEQYRVDVPKRAGMFVLFGQ